MVKIKEKINWVKLMWTLAGLCVVLHFTVDFYNGVESSYIEKEYKAMKKDYNRMSDAETLYLLSWKKEIRTNDSLRQYIKYSNHENDSLKLIIKKLKNER